MLLETAAMAGPPARPLCRGQGHLRTTQLTLARAAPPAPTAPALQRRPAAAAAAAASVLRAGRPSAPPLEGLTEEALVRFLDAELRALTHQVQRATSSLLTGQLQATRAERDLARQLAAAEARAADLALRLAASRSRAAALESERDALQSERDMLASRMLELEAALAVTA